ncbi:hypothetical protein HDV04_001584 [Boothiomyces sp. JEL0838]|nr:hypothetical protein HDV04_001584 [Boothiomyces sp. JEL0838]
MKKFTFAFKRKPKPRQNLKLFEPQFKADEFNFDVDIKDKVNLSPPIKPIKITNNIIPQPVKKIEVTEKKSEAVDWTDFLNQKNTIESDATRNLKQALQSNALSFTYITLFLQDNQDQLMHFSTTELLDIYSFYKKSKSLKLQEYHIFLKEFCWKGDVKGSLMVYADIKKSGIDPDHFQSKVLEMKTFEGLMAAHYEIGNNRAVTRLYDDYQQIYQPRLIAVKYYVKACSELELFHFVTTVSNKLLQERRLLDFDTYVALLESFEVSGNADLLTKWIKVIKEHLDSDNPISSNILRHLISAVSKIGTLEQGQDLFKEYLSHHEKYSVEINKVNDVNLSPKEMAEMFDCDNQDVLKKFKLWHSPTPARRVLSHMAYLYGKSHDSNLTKSHDSNLIKSFFTDHVLLSSSLHLHWSRFIKSNNAKLDDLLAKAQDKLDNGGDKSIKETISWVNKRKKRGLVLNTGVEGPFKYVYDGLIHGYKSRETDSALGLDNLLHELEEYEKATVASLPIKSKFVTLKEI